MYGLWLMAYGVCFMVYGFRFRVERLVLLRVKNSGYGVWSLGLDFGEHC